MISGDLRNWCQSEFSKRGVILAVDTLTLENRELHSLLVIGNSGESSLLDGWDSVSTGHNGGEDVYLGAG